MAKGERRKASLDFNITPEEVKQLQDRGEKLLLLDCREPWEYDTARIAGSTLIPMGDIPARVQELDPEERIVVYCHHGVRSVNVAQWLRQQGFDKAQSMSGGIARWSALIDRSVPMY